MNTVHPSQILNEELSKAAQEILAEKIDEKAINIAGTEIKFIFARENEAMIKKYKKDVLSTHEFHGERFMYIR